jgi:hypothetical protein
MSALRGSPWWAHHPSMRRIVLAMLLCSCGDTRAVDAGVDAGPRPDAGPAVPRYWPGELPSSSELGTRRGRSISRAIVHLHSPLSHDACDGEGWADGELLDPECLAHLRDGLCRLHIDAAVFTDHAPHVNERTLEQALWLEPGDEPIMNADGDVYAGRLVCDDGHRVLATVGSENSLMPLMLERPPGDTSDPAALQDVYDTDGSEGAALFRAAGGLVWQAHTEGRTLDELRAIGLDGLEIYNLHANVAPDIRPLLGLPETDYGALFDFGDLRLRLPPDLAIFAFIGENQPSLDRFDELLAENVRVSGSGGCDAHENALPMILGDGERADSYRRMMLWIQNHVLVDAHTPEAVREALDAGRMYVTFEVFGSPMGFDFVAQSGASTFEMGEDAPAGATLRVVRPSLPEGFPSDPAPVITMRILRSTATGGVEVATGSGETLEHVTTEPGAYRAEVRMIPEHARPALGARHEYLVREVVWVYSNPIFVVP